MVKRTITITTILLIITIAVGLLVMLNKSSYAADDDIASGRSGTCSWVIDSEGVLTISPTDGVRGTLENFDAYNYNHSWQNNNYKYEIKKVVVEDGVKTGQGCYNMFTNLINCTEMDLSNLDTSSARNMEGMFKNCRLVTSIDLSGFETEYVTDMTSMFYGCKALKLIDTSSFNTENVTNMSYMFNECQELTTLDVSGFNTENVTDMNCMFNGCQNLTTLDVSGFTTQNVTDMKYMFSNCRLLTTIDVSGFNTKNVTDMKFMFSNCKLLTTIDASSFNTENVTDMINMFSDCEALTTLDVSGFNTEKVTNMADMFTNCKELTTIDLSSFNTENVTNMRGMFYKCFSATSIDVSSFNTEKVTDMAGMFCDCRVVTTIDVSGFNTAKVTNFNSMFANCYELKSIDVSRFNTEKATDMGGMFANCYELTSIDVSGFNTEEVTNMGGMFYNLDNLAMIKLGENFSFDGKGNISGKAILPTPTGEAFTGKWIREDKAFGPYTPEELRDNYDGSTMAGTWIRERKQLTVSYNYSDRIPEGVSELPETKTYEVGEEVIVAPNATAPGYIFSGWKTQNVTITDGKFTMPNYNVSISGKFVPEGYIEYYTETLEGGKYELYNRDVIKASDILELDTDSTYWIYNIDNYNHSIDGFTYDYVLEDSHTYTLKLYYKRNTYNITYSYVGEVPSDASELPVEQSYKFEEKIELPEKAIAEGYTFSGWNTDYITMPAENIEITGYFIENESKEYIIEYYFDGKKDDSISETRNAKISQVVSINPQKSLKYKGNHYMLVTKEHEIKISENEEANIIKVYYETDVLGYTDENFNLGDGIPDKYQIAIYYKVENGSWDDDTKEAKTNVITLKDKDGNYAEDGTGELNIPQVGNKPAEGYEMGSWNTTIPKNVSSKDNGKEFVYSYKTISKADISEAKGKLSNPKTDDIMHNYIQVGIAGVLVLMIVRKIRRKYSRKAKKIQY